VGEWEGEGKDRSGDGARLNEGVVRRAGRREKTRGNGQTTHSGWAGEGLGRPTVSLFVARVDALAVFARVAAVAPAQFTVFVASARVTTTPQFASDAAREVRGRRGEGRSQR